MLYCFHYSFKTFISILCIFLYIKETSLFHDNSIKLNRKSFQESIEFNIHTTCCKGLAEVYFCDSKIIFISRIIWYLL